MTGTQLTIEDVLARVELNAQKARAARDRGIAIATSANLSWHARAVADLQNYLQAHGASLAETWRADFLNRGNLNPSSSNAWGAVVRSAVSQKLIEPTGEFRPGKSIKNHAHFYRVWRVKS